MSLLPPGELLGVQLDVRGGHAAVLGQGAGRLLRAAGEAAHPPAHAEPHHPRVRQEQGLLGAVLPHARESTLLITSTGLMHTSLLKRLQVHFIKSFRILYI